MLRNLRKEFGVAVGAGESAIRIDTDEILDAVKTVTEVCKEHSWEMRTFDVLAGTEWTVGAPAKAEPKPGKAAGPAAGPAGFLAAVGGGPKSPESVLAALLEFWQEPASPDPGSPGEVRPVVLVVKNLHLGFEGRREAMVALIQHLVNDKVCDHRDYRDKLKKDVYDPAGVAHDSETGHIVVGLMPPEARLPPEVDPLFKRLVHEIPDEEEMGQILDGVLPTDEGDDEDNPAGLTAQDRKRVCRFALGLTRLQAEGVFGASIVQFGRIDPEYVWREKSRILNAEKLVELHTGKETFADVAGLAGAKSMLKRLMTPDEFDDADPDVRAKGALFCGPPGVGKSLVAKATGNELGFPTLMVNPGNWMGSLVGESEAKTRRGFQIIRAHAPCIAVVD